jgi:glycine betaine/proline transport system permease protein
MSLVRITVLAAIVALAVVALMPGATAAQDSGAPCLFSGAVLINGEPAADGTEIGAEIEGDVHTTVVSRTPDGNATYTIEIAPPAGEEYPVCSTVIFTVGNLTADETGSFVPGYEFVVNLTAKAAQRPCVFHGTVHVDGKPVPDGTQITAIFRGDHKTKTGPAANGTSIYTLSIEPPEGEDYPVGESVSFVVDESIAKETGIFEPGGNFTLNLTAETEEEDVGLGTTIATLLIVIAAVVLLNPPRGRLGQQPIARYLPWLAGAGLVFAAVWLFSQLEWTFGSFPESLYIPLRDWVNTAIEWLKDNARPLFDVVETVIREPLVFIRDLLQDWLPWWSVVFLVALGAWLIAGVRVAAIAAIGLFIIGTLGRATHATPNYWDLAMETLSVMIIAVMASVIIGIPIGVVAGRSDRFEAAIRPVLDAMQTMPSFVYLIPGVAFFGLGLVPAVIATFIYSVPPCIRLTNLGIRQVSEEVVEAGKAFGSTGRQLLFKIQIPLALPTIMAGVTQTIMLALAMVVIASMIGAGGLGLEVLRGLETRDPGRAFAAGLCIVLLAIILDRIGQKIGERGKERAVR